MLDSEQWRRDRAFGILDGFNKRFVQTCAASLALFVAGVVPSLLAQEGATQGPPIRVNVNRVTVGVTVSDAQGRFVHDLNRSDFRIFDNGVEQPIADFLPVEQPAQVLLLIEAGPAVLFFAKDHVLAADQLVASLAPDDRVAIATYTKNIERVLDFTTNKTEARLALREISFVQGFGELNLFESVARAVDSLAAVPGKKTVVLLSTGVDTSPNVNWAGLQPKLQTADVRIIAVSLAGEIRKPAKKRKLTEKEKADRAQLQAGFAEGDRSLRQLSQATGGRIYFVESQADFAKAYKEIGDLLRHEYSLAFVPPALDGQVHELRVETTRNAMIVEHRPAYLAALAQ